MGTQSKCLEALPLKPEPEQRLAHVVAGAPHGFRVWIDGEFHRANIGEPGMRIVKLIASWRRLARHLWSSVSRRNLHRRNLHSKTESCRPVLCCMPGATSSRKAKQKGVRMRFQSIMRAQLTIAGLATVLSFPGVTKGQEISNTAFDDGPNAVPFAQPVVAQGAGNSSSTLPSAQATPPKAASDGPVTAQQTTAEREPSTIPIWIGATLVWIGAIGLYLKGPAKQLTHELRSLRDSGASTPGD